MSGCSHGVGLAPEKANFEEVTISFLPLAARLDLGSVKFKAAQYNQGLLVSISQDSSRSLEPHAVSALDQRGLLDVENC